MSAGGPAGGRRAGAAVFSLLGLLALVGLAVGAGPVAAAEPVWVGRFDAGLEPWREQALKPGLTPNRHRLRAWDGRAAVEIRSAKSFSLLARPLAVDLAATPVLCWAWRIDAPLKTARLGDKAGDDYAARLYISLAIPPEDQGFALRAKLALGRSIFGPELPDAALNYVWDGQAAVGTAQPNAYTDRAMMIVQRSGAAQAGTWVQERRDIAADARRHFGASARPVQIALAVDTDNTGESAEAGFADLHFVAADQPCAPPP